MDTMYAVNMRGEKTRIGKRGSRNRRILVETKETRPVEIGGIIVQGVYEHSYHATKGWRTRREVA